MPGGAGQSLVGLSLSDRTVRQGLGTSRQGRRGGERRRRKKKEVGAGRATTLWLSSFSGPCVSGVPGRGEKTTQASGVGHGPHSGQRGQLYPLCCLGLLGKALLPGHGTRDSTAPHGSPHRTSPGVPGGGCVSVHQRQGPHELLSPHLSSPGSASPLPAFLEVSALGASECQNLLHMQPDSCAGPLWSRQIPFHSRPGPQPLSLPLLCRGHRLQPDCPHRSREHPGAGPRRWPWQHP